MDQEPETPFDSIESAEQFVELLCETIEEARCEVQQEMARSAAPGDERRQQALQLVAYKLAKLAQHMGTSRRILNDLRGLRPLLLSERSEEKAAAAGAGGEGESGGQ